MGYLDEIASERDSLAARLARVEALADVIAEVEHRLRSYSHPEDARRIALLHIEAYREGRAMTRVIPPAPTEAST